MIEAMSVKLADAATLLSFEYKHVLAKRLVAEKVSRMGGFIFLMEMILNFTESGGEILNEHGAAIYVHPDIVEEAYDYELSFSWTTDIRVFAGRMPRRASPGKHLLRLQLWDAAYKIADRPIVIS